MNYTRAVMDHSLREGRCIYICTCCMNFFVGAVVCIHEGVFALCPCFRIRWGVHSPGSRRLIVGRNEHCSSTRVVASRCSCSSSNKVQAWWTSFWYSKSSSVTTVQLNSNVRDAMSLLGKIGRPLAVKKKQLFGEAFCLVMSSSWNETRRASTFTKGHIFLAFFWGCSLSDWTGRKYLDSVK